MAEERLIDDDKDRKYRIRINENGEEELVIVEEEEEEEVPVYDVEVDGEEGLSEEEISKRLEEKRVASQRRAGELKATAREKLAEGDFEGAQYALSQASEMTEYDGELYFLQLKAYTRGMTSFLELEKCKEASDGVREYSSAEQKEELKAISATLQERIKEFEEKCTALSVENERGKEERRALFAEVRKKALTVFCCTAVPFIALFVLAIVFSTMMFSDLSGIYMILTIVFSITAVIAFFVNVFTFSRFSSANKKVKLNEADTATKVGREYLACSEELESLKKIYSSFENDIS